MRPDFSIVITAYNIESYIERAIRSALAQRDVSIEVIFIDDCSTDNTYAIASAIQDNRLSCHRLEHNSGPSVARNTGFAKALGEWVSVLDGDDEYQPDRLANCLKCARTTGADIIVDNITARREIDGVTFVMFDQSDFAKKRILDLATFIEKNSSFFGTYTLGYLKPIFSTAFLRDKKITYDPAIHIGEDYMIMAEALASGAVCGIEPSAGYLYTIRAGSISYRLIPADLERMMACDQGLYSRYKLLPAAERARKKREAGIRDAYAFTLLVEGLKAKKIGIVFKAFLMSPTSPRHLGGAIKKRITKLNNIINSKQKVIT